MRDRPQEKNVGVKSVIARHCRKTNSNNNNNEKIIVFKIVIIMIMVTLIC